MNAIDLSICRFDRRTIIDLSRWRPLSAPQLMSDSTTTQPSMSGKFLFASITVIRRSAQLLIIYLSSHMIVKSALAYSLQ